MSPAGPYRSASTEFDDREVLKVMEPLEAWAHNCHAASVHLMRSGVLGRCRVARGACEGVGGQHSWVVLGEDCYDRYATIVDPTLWSYREDVEGVWIGSIASGLHTPHGSGSIFEWGRPDNATGPVMELTPSKPWSRRAQQFLDLLGPLDKQGWIVLAHAPVNGWPSSEIIEAMLDSGLGAYVPVDIVGMITRRNPGKLYLPDV